MHLRTPVRTPAKGWPFLQLPPGEYKLYERAELYYELRVSGYFSCYFRLAELEDLQAAGDVMIEGSWPD